MPSALLQWLVPCVILTRVIQTLHGQNLPVARDLDWLQRMLHDPGLPVIHVTGGSCFTLLSLALPIFS